MSVLCISRQFGAGGKTLGQRLAKRLGWTFVYNDILNLVANEAKVSLDWVEAVDKEAGDRLMRFVSGLVPSDFIERHLGENLHDFDERRYRRFLSMVIKRIADHGDAVMVGRGCQFILSDRPDAFRVLLVASHRDRVNFMMENYKLSQAKAESLVDREQRRRNRFILSLGVEKPDDPSHYHMALNTSLLGLGQAEDLIFNMVSAAKK
ncbi:hypothetical protein AAU61_18875 [Desulfocarbo indianensis]|nr:hypothetical protein AAU61_18875 [Desulfocarbo indianensis]